jgi:hypothetical protein
MTVSAYKCVLVLAYLLYVCMYRLKYMYQCVRINPTLIGKECKNKMYLQKEILYVYLCMTVSVYKYMLFLACTWVMGLRQVFLQGNVEKCVLLSFSSVNKRFKVKVSVFFCGSEKRGFFYSKRKFWSEVMRKKCFFE